MTFQKKIEQYELVENLPQICLRMFTMGKTHFYYGKDEKKKNKIVVLPDANLQLSKIRSGVSQGSVLGPLLFL